jgi:hypothetical protein
MPTLIVSCDQCKLEQSVQEFTCKQCEAPLRAEVIRDGSSPREGDKLWWSCFAIVGIFFLTLGVPWWVAAKRDHVATETELAVQVAVVACSCTDLCAPWQGAASCNDSQCRFQNGEVRKAIAQRLEQAIEQKRRKECPCNSPAADTKGPAAAETKTATETTTAPETKTSPAARPGLGYFCRTGEALPDKKDEAGAAIYLIPFFPGEATMAWPLGLSALALLLIWFWPSGFREGWRACRVFLMGLGLFVFLWLANFGSNYLRNFVTGYGDGRRAYGYASSDIGPDSAWVQLLLLFGLQSALLAAVWTISLADKVFDSSVSTDKDPTHSVVTEALSGEHAVRLSEAFARWQRISVLLVCGFVPGAFCFWRLVYKMHDTRYLLPAAIYHFVYAATWFIVSRPLAHLWKNWHRVRLLAVAKVGQEACAGQERADDSAQASGQSKVQLEPLIAALDELQPIAHNSAVLAVLGALVALLAPFYEVFAR